MSKKAKQHQQIVPGNSLAVQVVGTQREDLAHALKAWKRKVKSAGILEETKERREFIKPGVRKRKQLQHAQFMQMVRDLHSK
jgi:ribosomal protein S21